MKDEKIQFLEDKNRLFLFFAINVLYAISFVYMPAAGFIASIVIIVMCVGKFMALEQERKLEDSRSVCQRKRSKTRTGVKNAKHRKRIMG